MFSEVVAFLYIVWFSYLVKKMVSSPTSNFQSLSLLAHVITFLMATVFSISIALTFGFGLSVSALHVVTMCVIVNTDMWDTDD